MNFPTVDGVTLALQVRKLSTENLCSIVERRIWIAFGELDGYGVSLKYSPQEGVEMWGNPKTVDDIAMVFAKYCKGSIAGIPWSAQQLEPETEIIRQRLAAINLLGYLTINSQPAVNGAKSSHKIYGWGPKNGYVYQKAYLEFFVSPEKLEELTAKISKDPQVTYHAVNKQGDFKTNTQNDQPTAVTWGVFPGKEIIQPTIVESMAFMAWKVCKKNSLYKSVLDRLPIMLRSQ